MMDKASSIFVDQLAVEKILDEKLSKVCHRPRLDPEALLDEAFGVYGHPLGIPGSASRPEPDVITLQSPVQCEHPENQSLPLRFYPANKQRGVILLIHGLFEDNRSIYGFVIGELNRLGYSVYMTTLPFHHERTPKGSRFSGEFFLNADLGMTKSAFIQSVLEVRQTYEWIRMLHDVHVYIVGFSMGGTVAMAAAGSTDRIRGICIVNPAAMLCEVIWTSPLCATIKTDLMKAGWSYTEAYRVLATFDPFMLPRIRIAKERIMMVYALYDQITSTDQYEALISRWNLTNVKTYKAGHLNTLRVPRFGIDVAEFCNQLNAGIRVSTQGSPS